MDVRRARLGVVAAAAVLAAAPGARAAVPSRILYVSDWSGRQQVYALDPAGRAPLGRLSPSTAGGDFDGPVASPDGARVLYRQVLPPTRLWLARADGSGAHLVAETDGPVSWAPDSRHFAYAVGDPAGDLTVHRVAADGSGDVVVGAHLSGDSLVWSRDGSSVTVRAQRDVVYSPDGRWRVRSAPAGTLVVERAGVHPVRVRALLGSAPVWSPDGRLLAWQGLSGIRLLDLRSGMTRRLASLVPPPAELVWAPDSSALAFRDQSGDLRVVTLAGRLRTVLRNGAPGVGQIGGFAWARTTATAYPSAPQEPGVYVAGGVGLLAADGTRVVFSQYQPGDPRSILGILEWTRSTGEIRTLVDDATFPAFLASIALAGDTVAYTIVAGSSSRYWQVKLATPPAAPVPVNSGAEVAGYAYPAAAGHGSVLAYATRNTGTWPDATWVIRRGDGTPLLTFVQSPSVAVGLKVDGDRVLVARAGSVDVLLAANGGTILHLPILADPTVPDAQLTGQHVAVRVADRLYDYGLDGALLHVWPIAAGALLQDAAAGLVAYIADGVVHVLALADGSDRMVAPGITAAFNDAGLAYANGKRLALVPYAQLHR